MDVNSGYVEHDEWKYEDRRGMQEVYPGLYLGPYSVAKMGHVSFFLHSMWKEILRNYLDVKLLGIIPLLEYGLKALWLTTEKLHMRKK